MNDAPPKRPSLPPKKVAGGKTLRMAPPKMPDLLSLDEPVGPDAGGLTLSDLDLDEPVMFAPGKMPAPPTAPPAVPKAQPMPPPPPFSGLPPVPATRKQTMEGPAPAMPQGRPPLKVTGALLGHILVDNGLLTEAQRDFVLKLQMQSGHTFRIGELAVKQGFLSPEDLERALAAQKTFVKGVHQEQSRMIKLPEEVARMELVEEDEKAGQRGEVQQLEKWLLSALKHGASDLHVMAGRPLVLRHLGKLVQSKQPPMTAEAVESALLSVLDREERAKLEEEQSIVKCLDLRGKGRARGNIFRHMNGMNGTFRLIPDTPPSLVSLNLPSRLAKFTTYAQGLVLVTGPIGCGKTTTMAALVDIVNKERREHILTVERPLEFIHRHQKSLVTQRQVGTHTNSFSIALRAALREDPDVIAVGEMNDIETARLTISAAETGHLVFATLHTDNAVRTVNRVLDIFPPDEQNQIRAMISESLRGVICQRLVPREDEPGLIPIVEMLFTTPAMRNLIREQKVYQLPNAISMSRDLGNMTFKDHAQELLQKGQISQKTFDSFTVEEM
jgi:twitching motility protein PilT